MAKKPAPTEQGSADFADAALPTTSTDTAPAEQPAAPAPLPSVRSDSKPLKPGVRKMTLAQARAHHAQS